MRAAVWALILLASLPAYGVSEDGTVQELRQEIEKLKAIVGAQQKELQELRRRVGEKGPGPAPAVTVPSKSSFSLYGFLRVDAIWDTGQTNNAQTPFFVQSPSRPGTGRTGNRQFTVHPRLTRIGLNWSAPGSVQGFKVNGRFEIDWQNAQGLTPESRQIPRIRHAYVELQGKEWNFLLGQTWDLISPLFPSPNDDTLMWNAGNLGDRRPQVRFTYTPQGQRWTTAFAVGLTGAIDAKDLDGNGIRDGEDSGLPNVQFRVGLQLDKGTVGLWSHYAWEQTTAPVGGAVRFSGYSFGSDWNFPLGNGWTLRGEGWIGRNLSDFRGGIGQGVLAGNEVRSRGGWLELGYQLSPTQRLALGYTFDDPRDGDVPPTPVPPAPNPFAFGRIRNSSWYLHYRVRLSSAVELAVNYLYWQTRWRGQPTGTDHRVNLFVQQNF